MEISQSHIYIIWLWIKYPFSQKLSLTFLSKQLCTRSKFTTNILSVMRILLGISVHQGRVTHICVHKLGHTWLREWLIACSVPSQCLNQCWLIFNRPISQTPQFTCHMYTIENRNGHISVPNGVLCDMEQVHCGICETGLLDPQEQSSGKSESKYNNFHPRKCNWKCCLPNNSRFASTPKCYTTMVGCKPSGDVWRPDKLKQQTIDAAGLMKSIHQCTDKERQLQCGRLI